MFASARDLAVFASMMACGGLAGDGRRFLGAETIVKYTAAVAPAEHSRALGWDTKSGPAGYSSAGEGGTAGGPTFGKRSFGHTGFTGTTIWIGESVPAQSNAWRAACAPR